MRLKKNIIIGLLILSGCASSSYKSSETYNFHYKAQVIKVTAVNYENNSSIRAVPDMGIWVSKLGSDNNLEFIENRKKTLVDASRQAMEKTCKGKSYKLISDYSYGMYNPQKTNEPISTVFMTVKEKMNSSYETLPSNLEVDFVCN